MSFFGVLIRKIKTLDPIPGADRIQVATIEDCAYQFVVAKGLWAPGDTGLYFLIDSLFPTPLLQAMGLEGKLSGPNKNRVKSVKLRGQISQGILGPMSLIDGLDKSDPTPPTPEAIAQFLGVTKYEPPLVRDAFTDLAQRAGLPGHLSKYDIESAQMNTAILDLLMDEPVLITEKVEGQNHCVTFVPGENGNPGKASVCTRGTTLEPLPDRPLLTSDNVWITLARQAGLLDLVAQASGEFAQPVTVYSEKTGPGVQGNIYRFPEPALFCFDVKVGPRFLNVDEFETFAARMNTPRAPVISRGQTLRQWLSGRDLVTAAHGKSALADTLREGIVVRPMTEREIPAFGRLILKVRDPIYLAASDN
jgi:RNA ligase (TIGR02306 family)